MTEEEREKLIDKMVVAMSTHIPGDNVQSGDVFDAAIAALAVAEDAIRKDCAKIAEFEYTGSEAQNVTARMYIQGRSDASLDILNSIRVMSND
jgi:hypothetical protein